MASVALLISSRHGSRSSSSRGRGGGDLGFHFGDRRLDGIGRTLDLLAPRLPRGDAFRGAQPLLQSRDCLVQPLHVRRRGVPDDRRRRQRLLRLRRARRSNLSQRGPLIRKRARELQSRDASLRDEDLAELLASLALRLERAVELGVGDEPLLREDLAERARGVIARAFLFLVRLVGLRLRLEPWLGLGPDSASACPSTTRSCGEVAFVVASPGPAEPAFARSSSAHCSARTLASSIRDTPKC